MTIYHSLKKRDGFSLIEVVLAIGIFLVTVLALVGLLGPTLRSVDEVEKADEVSSVVNTIDTFLQSSVDIAPNASRFDAIYTAVTNNGSATLLVFRQYDNNNEVSLKIGFVGDADPAAQLTGADISSGQEIFAAGPIFRAVLTASSVNPEDEMNVGDVSDYPRYTMIDDDPDDYPEAYFAMEVRIFTEDPSIGFQINSNLQALRDVEPIFTYNAAIVR